MSCNRYLRLFCYHNEEVENRDCCGDTKTGHKYLNGVAIFSGSKLLAMLERPFNVSDLGELVTVKDVNEQEYTFRASQTKYSHDQLIEFLNNCNSFFESEWGKIGGDIESQEDLWIELQKRNNICNVRYFGDGEELPDTLVDCVLYIKDGKYYVNDGGGDPLDVTPESGVLSVTGSDGIEVDNTDPQNPIVGLDQDSQDSLDLADSAVQPGDLADVATSGEFGDLQNVPDFIEDSEKGAPGGVAELDGAGKVIASQLPSYVDDVVEVANFASLPVTGESGKIYVTIDDNLTYRWSGSAYVEISPSLALGETSSTAYRGDRGKTAYDHSQQTSGNPHNVTASEVGLGNVDNTSDADKPVSTAQGQAINQAEADAKQYTDDEINALNLGSASQADVGDFIASAEKGAVNGVTPLGADQKVPNQYLPAIAISEVIEATETDIATFAANSANYTFQTGDVILIDDNGNLKHYIYKGGTKTDVNEYSPISATQIDWTNVLNKPTDLQDNLFTKDLTLGANRTHDLGSNVMEFRDGFLLLRNGALDIVNGGIGGSGSIGMSSDNGEMWLENSRVAIYVTLSHKAGIEAHTNALWLWDAKNPSAVNDKHNVYLKRVSNSSIAQWTALTIPEYASDAAADNDIDLAANAPYAITGERGVKVKNGAPIPDYYLQQLYLSQEDFQLQQKYIYDTGAQDFAMDYDFQDVVDVFVNGTRLARTEYTLTYNQVTIEGVLTQGDKVVINYTHRCDFDNAYGIRRDKTIASPDWERIGKDMTLHASLPVQSGMRRCVLDDNGDVVYYLDANDSSLQEDGVTPAVLDGTDGQLMVEIPRHFERFNEYEGVQYVFISEDPFPGAFMVEKMYVSTDECTIHRPSNTLASVINTTADYRGGNNQSTWDATAQSMLGMAVTNQSLINFNTYARNRGDGWRCMYYDPHRVIAWLITVEYATYYHQQAYNPTLTPEGYRQGGLGGGPTGINNSDWVTFNDRYPLIPIGTTLSLGNNTGEVVHTIQDFPTAGNTQDITSNSYRGIANWYGHLFEWTDGIRFEASNGGATREIFKEVGEAYSTNNTVGYKSIGFTPQANGYITEIVFGKDGDIIATQNNGGSSATYLTDYFYMSGSDGYRGLLRSGRATYGTAAGSFVASSGNGVAHAYSYIGSRLCFFPEKRETDA